MAKFRSSLEIEKEDPIIKYAVVQSTTSLLPATRVHYYLFRWFSVLMWTRTTTLRPRPAGSFYLFDEQCQHLRGYESDSVFCGGVGSTRQSAYCAPWPSSQRILSSSAPGAQQWCVHCSILCDISNTPSLPSHITNTKYILFKERYRYWVALFSFTYNNSQ